MAIHPKRPLIYGTATAQLPFTLGDEMANDLTKMGRWNSEPLDVHTWSDHPEVKTLCDDLYDLAGMTILESQGNRKA